MSVARDLTRKFKCSQALIGKYLNLKNIKHIIKRSLQRFNDGKIKAILRSKTLYKLLTRESICIIEDDEI